MESKPPRLSQQPPSLSPAGATPLLPAQHDALTQNPSPGVPQQVHKPFRCPVDGCKRFTRRTGVKDHIKLKHAGALTEAELTALFLKEEQINKNVKRSVPCRVPGCGKTFLTAQTMSAHLTNVHNIKNPKDPHIFPCLIAGCTSTPFAIVKDLANHLSSAHGASRQYYYTRVRYFDSMESFEAVIAASRADEFVKTDFRSLHEWKHVPARQKEWKGGRTVPVVLEIEKRCSRHAVIRAPQATVRVNRAKGTKAVGRCPARLWLQMAESGEVKVTTFNYHYHPLELKYLDVPKVMRAEIKHLTHLGVGYGAIYKQVSALFETHPRVR
ncbi:hypothetical protein PTSG_00917 [Salpingoeca rosetta]|uniref:C2H2-type domain-containing protein n=1 Tax=Salpingoeca rosetta (strain ATCC 50818 / BSB-021) TaxID=946362 RepID=F2TXV5_SALR5|nr:uncharacterized protein PTSG_00917 [Salpingoeca rosetta]EGD76214.1 hypothetical protein PTSG_00917 [Salpingoeca rosetta]|eukprot:XP_004998389.1 hypothetical protein PTSG_00917 [Salpingoeca rosetta]